MVKPHQDIRDLSVGLNTEIIDLMGDAFSEEASMEFTMAVAADKTSLDEGLRRARRAGLKAALSVMVLSGAKVKWTDK